jgi:hypothetical protein
MYALMFYKTALSSECLITHITSIRAFTTMCALMCYQSDLSTECLITHITSKRELTTMCALMCYKTALMTECLITHITSIREFTTMYITGIPAFSTVYMKLFIQSALVKKQRLNIRIYSDRKNNYFHSNVYIK